MGIEVSVEFAYGVVLDEDTIEKMASILAASQRVEEEDLLEDYYSFVESFDSEGNLSRGLRMLESSDSWSGQMKRNIVVAPMGSVLSLTDSW